MLRRTIERFFGDDTGATMVEYGLLVALVSVTLISILFALGGSLGNVYTTAGTGMTAVLTSVGE